MTILKNKRRTSRIEYERTFLSLYEYMTGLIDTFPRRYMQPLGKPMKMLLNEIYDDVTKISDMYVEKEENKARYLACRKAVDGLISLQSWIYLYWILSDGRNGLKWVTEDRRKFMSAYVNKEIYLLAGVMYGLDKQHKYSEIEVQYMYKFMPWDAKKTHFLEKLYELNSLVYPKTIRIPLAQRDEEVSLACRYIRDAFYCAYAANNILPQTKKEYDRRRRLFGEAISDLYRLNRPMLKLFMVHLFSNEDMEKITTLVNESTKYLQGVQASDKERFGGLC